MSTTAAVTSMAGSESNGASPGFKPKLHGRAFYESIGSPKFVVAPMVDQSEFAWRMLTRSFMPESQRSTVLGYTPMFHARLFGENPSYRDSHFQPMRKDPTSPDDQPTPWLDGNPAIDRPLFVQFCANDPSALLEAAKHVAPYCDAVDLNLGCPQGIARKGHYGAFLQEDQELIHKLIRQLHDGLSIPVTAKIRILDTPEATLAYARNVLDAGASILTVHGRRREQKGHLTGVADWSAIRHLRENLPPETVIFANGNILQRGDLERCLEATGADAVMSAEGNLSDPTLFAPEPPVGEEGREYWRGRDGLGGFRVDAVMRRYLDILHRYVEDKEPPARRPLFIVGEDETWISQPLETQAAPQAASQGGETEEAPVDAEEDEDGQPARKKRRKNHKKKMGATETGIGKKDKNPSPNYIAVKAHLFHMLRHFITKHTDVRDAVARSRLGEGHINYLERILDMVERKVAQGMIEYERTEGRSFEDEPLTRIAIKPQPQVETKDSGVDSTAPAEAANGQSGKPAAGHAVDPEDDPESSFATVKKCRRPWWVVQPIVRPLPLEAAAKGAVTMKKTKENKAGSNGKQEDVTRKRPHPATESTVEALDKETTFPTSDLVSG
ncbi:hypothetical protein MCOR25_008952 [Pyricularia grisea]|uniref:tRNA-dihydrouridine(16/17) synthase [NAD(P)(+)] n=1 Tax=Pyricularia grisea TaxID=148305 RepID=A0A6P8B8H6_PYRGI|nr:uncharacterized protein PgNI_04586 [Pyricularia grisea]KAI6353548.1 hypothetical protein MCOR25_008952 [Pyricularia grisea]TLD12145.1 hypothetical protein PgNI_04586 [Pyricularia grisea]